MIMNVSPSLLSIFFTILSLSSTRHPRWAHENLWSAIRAAFVKIQADFFLFVRWAYTTNGEKKRKKSKYKMMEM